MIVNLTFDLFLDAYALISFTVDSIITLTARYDCGKEHEAGGNHER